jgi:hypothetical protein
MSLVFYYDLQMFAITCMHILHNRVGVLPIVEDHTVTVKCRTAINALFLYLNLGLKNLSDYLVLNLIMFYKYLILERHDIAKILLRLALNTHQSINQLIPEPDISNVSGQPCKTRF